MKIVCVCVCVCVCVKQKNVENNVRMKYGSRLVTVKNY